MNWIMDKSCSVIFTHLLSLWFFSESKDYFKAKPGWLFLKCLQTRSVSPRDKVISCVILPFDHNLIHRTTSIHNCYLCIIKKTKSSSTVCTHF